MNAGPATIAIALIAVGTLATGGCLAQDPPRRAAAASSDSDLNETVINLPEAARDGAATIEQIKAWVVQESLYLFPGVRAEGITLEVRNQDLDLDGTADMLIGDPRRGGSGGSAYSAFLATSRGYRYIGHFQGAIRALPVEPGRRIRMIIATRTGGGSVAVQLAELHEDGLHRVARGRVAAGDSGTDEGNRLYWELMHADVVSAETLRQVFGPI